MDDIRFGSVVRAARIRRGWRQEDLAAAASVSQSTVSRIELGRIDETSFGMLRAVARVFDIRVELLPRSRHADVDRAINARHAALAEFVLGWISSLPGWVARPEISFAFYADRGVVDIVAWHAASGCLLLIEIKTEIIDVGGILGTFDRKRRVATKIGEMLGWQPRAIGVCMLVAESATNRRRVAEHSATFRASLPSDGAALRAWLRNPTGELRALAFVADTRPGNARSSFAAPRRVSTSRARAAVRKDPRGQRV